MGDITIVNAPFIITVPDDWEVTTSEDGYTAKSPDAQTNAMYSLSPGSTLEEATSIYFQGSIPEDLMIAAPINGMDFLLFTFGLPCFEYVDSPPSWNFYPMQPPEPDEPAEVKRHYVHAFFAAYQGTVLQVLISNMVWSTSGTQNRPLLILSGIWPAPPAKFQDLAPLRKIKVTHLMDHGKLYQKLRTGKVVSHAGSSRKVDVPRKVPFGRLPETVINYEALYECLLILREVLKGITDAKYADYVKNLEKVYNLIYSLMHPVSRKI